MNKKSQIDEEGLTMSDEKKNSHEIAVVLMYFLVLLVALVWGPGLISSVAGVPWGEMWGGKAEFFERQIAGMGVVEQQLAVGFLVIAVLSLFAMAFRPSR